MAQVAATRTADDLGATHAEGAVGMARHGAGDAVEVRGPAAAGLELVAGFVERRGTGGARVDARGRHVFVVGAGEGRLGAFLAEDAELFWGVCQWSVTGGWGMGHKSSGVEGGRRGGWGLV